jgi:shikimate kinase
MILKLKQTPGIYLVGFMGSGKSTIGHLLAGHIGWHFADLDRDIEIAHGATISTLFETLGEPGFRRIEADALARRVRAVKTGCPMVLALGGGAYIQPGNAALVDSSGVSVWLDAPFDTIQRRVGQTNHRPLAADPVFFRELFLTRREAYARARYKVEITSDDPAIALAQLLALSIFDK